MCRIVTYNIHSGIGRDKKHDYKRIGTILGKQWRRRGAAARNRILVPLSEVQHRTLKISALKTRLSSFHHQPLGNLMAGMATPS